MSDKLTILAEEVGEGAEYVRLLEPGSLPNAAGNPNKALKALEELVERTD